MGAAAAVAAAGVGRSCRSSAPLLPRDPREAAPPIC